MTQHETNIILDEDQYEWLRAFAFNQKFSMSAIVRLALTDYMSKIKSEEFKAIKKG